MDGHLVHRLDFAKALVLQTDRDARLAFLTCVTPQTTGARSGGAASPARYYTPSPRPSGSGRSRGVRSDVSQVESYHTTLSPCSC